MTEQDKQLLLQDLCARLPYDVIVRVHDIKYGDFDSYIDSISNTCVETYPVEELTIDFNPCVFYKLQDIKPYLRSMSSMTNEERSEWISLMRKEYREQYPYSAVDTSYYEYFPTIESFDYLNSNHFDFRGLIPIDLALEAKKGMYKNG